jgi:hypothetical protein
VHSRELRRAMDGEVELGFSAFHRISRVQQTERQPSFQRCILYSILLPPEKKEIQKVRPKIKKSNSFWESESKSILRKQKSSKSISSKVLQLKKLKSRT